jgi:hypothetical protein
VPYTVAAACEAPCLGSAAQSRDGIDVSLLPLLPAALDDEGEEEEKEEGELEGRIDLMMASVDPRFRSTTICSLYERIFDPRRHWPTPRRPFPWTSESAGILFSDRCRRSDDGGGQHNGHIRHRQANTDAVQKVQKVLITKTKAHRQ